MQVADGLLELIGNTPLVKVTKIAGATSGEVWAKLESYNPGGSVKDRIALSMIETAERDGSLKPGGTIVEPTSGNTGIGLAWIAAAKGYRLILCMPETMSIERRTLLKVYGAELVLTPGELGMRGAIDAAMDIVSKNPRFFMPQQFNNPANPEIHRRTTAKEILRQIDGTIDAFVAGVGTGGSLTGVGESLRQAYDRTKIFAVEPAASPVLSGGRPGPHRIQGIGAGFVPEVLNKDIIDRIIAVDDDDAIRVMVDLARKEGLFCGISSGAAMFAALEVAKDLGPGTKTVVILPDSGERYLSLAHLFPLSQ